MREGKQILTNMIKILFICHGNICRSPMAEFMLKDKVEKLGIEDGFYIASAATSSEEIWNGVGSPVYPPARRELAAHGISCEGKRAVQLTRADYDKYDYLICMDKINLRNAKRIVGGDEKNKISLLLDYAKREGQSIADPWYSGDFKNTYRDIEEGLDGLLEHLNLF